MFREFLSQFQETERFQGYRIPPRLPLFSPATAWLQILCFRQYDYHNWSNWSLLSGSCCFCWDVEATGLCCQTASAVTETLKQLIFAGGQLLLLLKPWSNWTLLETDPSHNLQLSGDTGHGVLLSVASSVKSNSLYLAGNFVNFSFFVLMSASIITVIIKLYLITLVPGDHKILFIKLLTNVNATANLFWFHKKRPSATGNSSLWKLPGCLVRWVGCELGGWWAGSLDE